MGYFKAYDRDDEEVQTTKNKGTKESYDAFFSNKISIASCIFDIVFINKGDEKEKIADEKVLFTASWKLKDDETLGINDILEFIGIKSLKIPKGIDLDLSSANIKKTVKENYRIEAESKNYGKLVFVSYKENKDDESKNFLSVKTDKNINLTNLPLVNQVFDKKHSLAIKDIQIVYASDEFEDRISEKINKFIKDGYGKIDKDNTKGFCISLDLDIAGYIEKLSLSTTQKEDIKQIKTTKGKSNSNIELITSNSKKQEDKTSNKEHGADGTLWYKLNKKLGPVSFEKIGLKFDGRLYIFLNSSLNTSGLSIELVQAAFSIELTNKINPLFNLKGLGVGYTNSTFEIDGTLITQAKKERDTQKDSMEYSGGAVLKTKGFSLDAFGSYYDSEENTSMFIFLEVDRVFGGPPSFILTGILGGFGYNSELRIPDIDEIGEFPFISGLDDPEKIGNTSKEKVKKATTPTQALVKLTNPENTKPWVTPKVGNIWVAAGIKFSSFELMKSTAIVVGEFAKDFSLSIIGNSKGQFPKKEKDSIKNNPFVNFDLSLRAYFNPNMGEISFISKLSKNSYILNKNCHITGSFAMCFWFGDNSHSGDFVISMGGYSPYFFKPNHYPALDRVGVNWKVNDDVVIKGGAYFAVTPSAAMLGGNIEILFNTGAISAWVKGNYDVIVWWNPFYFIAEVSVRVGAGVKLLGKKISVELGCMLGLWGPAFGGKVKVKILFVITFTIKFGASKKMPIRNLTWDQFKENLPDSQNLIKVVPLKGLAPKSSAEDENGKSINEGGDESLMVVRPSMFEFKTECQIPNSKLDFENKNKGEDSTRADYKKINIKPMGEKSLDSFQKLKINRIIKAEEKEEDTTLWIIEENIQNVPQSLWGTGYQGNLISGKDVLIEFPIGFIVRTPPPKVSQKTLEDILIENISYSLIDCDKDYLHHPLDINIKGKIMDFSTNESIKKISKIKQSNNRDRLHSSLSSLGFELDNDSLEDFSKESSCYFTDAPMIKKSK